MYNLTAEDLKYKWEALIFGKAKSILRFTRESVADLKAEIQREIQAKNASSVSRSAGATTFARGKLAGSAKFAGVNSAGLTGALKTAAQPPKALSGGTTGVSVKLEQNFDSPIPSSSRITFVGPEGGRETRACEHHIPSCSSLFA
jgi:DNA polymerase alpha subunit B